MTESGKTSLAKQLATEYLRHNKTVIVFDPLNDVWPCTYQTNDPTLFLQACRENTNCYIFIDEASENVGQHDTEMHWLATRGRHFGHSVHFVSQRGAQLSKTVRDQTSFLFLFACSIDDSKILANEYNKPELREANTLEKLEYFKTGRFTNVERHKITFDNVE